MNEGDHINSGGFLIRNSSWSLQFLRDWWEMDEKAEKRILDQGPLMHVVLESMARDLGVTYDLSCRRIGKRMERCWNDWISRLGLEFNRRFTAHILFFPCNESTIRGFNFYAQGCHSHPCQCFINGDFAAHTHHLEEFSVGFSASYCPKPWKPYLHFEIGLKERVKPWHANRTLSIFHREMVARSAGSSIFRVAAKVWISKAPYVFAVMDLNSLIDPRTIIDDGGPIWVDGVDFHPVVLQKWRLDWDGKPGPRRYVARVSLGD